MAELSQSDKDRQEKIAREKMRAVALKNLQGYNNILAGISLAEGNYGRANNSIEEFIYNPVMTNEELRGEIIDKLKKNRTNKGQNGGNRYTGTISEGQIMGDAIKIVHESIGNITFDDLYKLMHLESEVPKDLKGRYIGQSNVRDKITEQYMGRIARDTVAEAMMLESAMANKGLEKLLAETPATIGGK